MPELPEVHTVCVSLRKHVVGRRIEEVTVFDGRLRFPVQPDALSRFVRGQTITEVRRRAKYILLCLENGATVLIHLGMSGRIGIYPRDASRQKHDHVVFAVEGGEELRFNDARRFGMIDVIERGLLTTHPRLVHLGCEPLSDEFNGEALHRLSRGCRVAIKNFIMDARRVVGVGNIYASEALFDAGISPRVHAGRLSLKRCGRLAETVKTTLQRAIDQGGTTIRDFQNLDGSAGYFVEQLQVYGREGLPCARCSKEIRRLLQAGRSTFYCTACQR
jgi:formamidopyrimidine-DNA glycosylase